MRTDIMVDIETLGTGEDASIFQICAMSFDITNGEIKESINLIGDIEKYEILNVDGSTLKWWLSTDKELFSRLLLNGGNSEQELYMKLSQWMGRYETDNLYLWGNGILFDNAKLQYNMNKHEGYSKYPIFFRNDRDVRTIVELACMKSGISEKELKNSVSNESETKHDAFDDVKFQIRLVHKCYNIIMNK